MNEKEEGLKERVERLYRNGQYTKAFEEILKIIPEAMSGKEEKIKGGWGPACEVVLRSIYPSEITKDEERIKMGILLFLYFQEENRKKKELYCQEITEVAGENVSLQAWADYAYLGILIADSQSQGKIVAEEHIRMVEVAQEGMQKALLGGEMKVFERLSRFLMLALSVLQALSRPVKREHSLVPISLEGQ